MNGRARTRAVLMASVVAATTTALTLSAPLASADDHGRGDDHGHGRFTPGAPGVGDRYYPLAGNGGYDVRHYDITGTYDPASDVWSATTVISAKATQNLSRFNLDFDGMTIRRLEVNGSRATWVRNGAELVVTPKHRIRAGSQIRVKATYSGVPKEFVLPLDGFSLRTGFMATDDGATVAGQPDVAAGWFPVNDHPRDKASYDFHVTVPRGLGVVANGFLAGQRTRGDSTRFDWHAPEPMSSYLATIDIGKWDVRKSRTASGIPVYDAVDPDLLADPVYGPSIEASLARQGEILGVLSSAFGKYPFRTVGAIIDDQDDLFFALETQTRPVYSKYFWPDGGDSVIAHELAHQWYGDDVALKQWQDIWLNEGWATYAEWVWAEHEGLFTPQDAFDSLLQRHPGRRSVLAVRRRSAAAGRPVRRPGLHPGRDDAAGAAQPGGRRRLLPDRPAVGGGARWWHRHDRPVHRARRAGVRAAARRPVRRLAVHRVPAHAHDARSPLRCGAVAGCGRGAHLAGTVHQAHRRRPLLSRSAPG